MPKCHFNIVAKNLRVVLISPGGIRSSPPEMFFGRGVLKICIKFTGEEPCRDVISIKLLYNVIEIMLWHGCSPVNFQNTFSY